MNFGDIDGEIDARPRACGHAEFIGANEAAGEAHGVIACNRMDGFWPVVRACESDELAGIAADGACIHAGLRLALQASVEFGL